jgi:hypothetical protein
MNKQELRELILDQKERGRQSFNQLDDDKQNVIVSALILDLPAYRRFECIEDISMDQLQYLVAFNATEDYLAMGKIMSHVLKQNMLKLCEAEYENTVPDYEAANIDDRIDAMKEREAVV